MSEYIRVMGRVRPSAQTVEENEVISIRDSNTLEFTTDPPKFFQFDQVFDKYATQEAVFEELGRRIVDGCVDGYNGTIFAYGQTGSGKTHTMLGPSHIDGFFADPIAKGLIPRAAESLFARLDSKSAEKGDHFKYTVKCSFVELYNETVYDLLDKSQQKIAIRNDNKGVYLLGLTEEEVQSCIDMMRIVHVGWESRRVGETAMNRESSRSHAIFIVDIHTEELMNTIVNKRSARLNLVDLAGSERQTQSKASGDRFKEATHINGSLSVLGRVIRTLSKGQENTFIPYRDSKLTHILRDSLGGNSRTAVIVNLHPDATYYADTLSTLQFAEACSHIKNRVQPNEDLSGESVVAWKAEISRLRELLREKEDSFRKEMDTTVKSLENERDGWKQAAVMRQKELGAIRLDHDCLILQLKNKLGFNGASGERDILLEIKKRLWIRIDNAHNLEELNMLNLDDELSRAKFENDELRSRLHESEAARKALSEKYQSALNGTVIGSPLRATLEVAHSNSSQNCMTPKERRKERRMTRFTPAAHQTDRRSAAFRPVLDFGCEQDENRYPMKMEQEQDNIKEHELLRLETENNRLTQILDEKESVIKQMGDMERRRHEEWQASMEKHVQREADLKEGIERLEISRRCAEDALKLEKIRADNLAAKMSTIIEEKRNIQKMFDESTATNITLEEQLREVHNELEGQVALREMLVKERIIKLEKEFESRLTTKENTKNEEIVRLKEEFMHKNSELELKLSELTIRDKAQMAMVRKLNEVKSQSELEAGKWKEQACELNNKLDSLKEAYTRSEERVEKLKQDGREEYARLEKLHQRDLLDAQKSLKLEQSSHSMTRQKLKECRDSCGKNFERKVAEMRETFSLQEQKMNMDINDQKDENAQLREEKEVAEQVINNLKNEKEALETTISDLRVKETDSREEILRLKRELDVLRKSKEEDDRAMVDMAGHHNTRQKVSYLDKLRKENYDLNLKVKVLEAQVFKLTKPAATGSAGPLTRNRSNRGGKTLFAEP